MNALLRLALKGSAIGAVALLTAAAGCSDSDKDDNDGAAGDSTTGGTTNGGSSSNAGDKGTPGGDKGTAGDDGNAGGTSNAGGDATGGVDNGAGGGTDIVFAQGGDANAGGAGTGGPAIARFCNDLTIGPDDEHQEPTTLRLEIGEGADKVTFTATTGECAPADGEACAEIPTGTDVPIQMVDPSAPNLVLDSATATVRSGQNWLFYTDLTDEQEPQPIFNGGALESPVCDDIIYTDIYPEDP